MIIKTSITLLLFTLILPGAPPGTIDPDYDQTKQIVVGPDHLFDPNDLPLQELTYARVFSPKEDLQKLMGATGGGGMKSINSWLIQPDGRFLVGGVPGKNLVLARDSARQRKVTGWGKKEYSLNRFDSNGSVDDKFLPGADYEALEKGRGNSRKQEMPGEVKSLALHGDGKILISGEFKFEKDGPLVYFTRLHPNGALDIEFQQNLALWEKQIGSPIDGFVLQADGKILVTGRFRDIGKTPASTLARLMPDGTLDPSFAPPSSRDQPEWVVILGDGKILIHDENSTKRLLNDPVVEEFKRHQNGLVTWKRGGSAPEIIEAIVQVKKNGKWLKHSNLQRIKGGWKATRKIDEEEIRGCGIVRLTSLPDKFFSVIQMPR